MIKKYFVEYGCYIGMTRDVWEWDENDLEKLGNQVYESAREATEGWVGCHGFCPEEQYEGMSDQEREEQEGQDVEDACEYTFELYNPEEHDQLI